MERFPVFQRAINRRPGLLRTAIILVILSLIAQPALAGNVNPGVAPPGSKPYGKSYGQWGEAWWLWAYSFPAADVPFFNTGGPVDISAGQSGRVWFLAGQPWWEKPVTRSGTIPSGTALFFPLANLINDYPCPDPSFKPDPGETMEEFLLRTGNAYFTPDPTDLFAEIDGDALTDLTIYKANSSLFWFTADPALTWYDPCITGTPQQGVAIGYWIFIPPLPVGAHTLHFGAPSWGQDITYELTVTPGH